LIYCLDTDILIEYLRGNEAIKRAVCSNLAEAWRKRKYEAVFKNKLTDSMQEASETQTWLEFSLACRYIAKGLFEELDSDYEGTILMINAMEKNAQKFCF